MTYEIAITLGLLLTFILVAASNIIRVEVAAVAFALLLSFSGIITPTEAFSGFASHVVIIIAALLVLSAGITQSGFISFVGNRIANIARKMPFLVIVLVMIMAALLGMFVNNTGATALLLPTVMIIAREAKISPSKLLIPLAFGSVLGGMCTLVGSTTNIIVNGIMKVEGIKPFSFFEFGYVGWMIAIGGIAYMAIIGIRLLPGRRTKEQELTSDYKLKEYLIELIIPEGSSLIGKTIKAAKFTQKYNLTILTIKRQGTRLVAAGPDEIFQANDRLVVEGKASDITNIAGSKDIQTVHDSKIESGFLQAQDIKIYEVTLAPQSMLQDRTPQQAEIRKLFGATILAILRRGSPIRININTTTLQFGDALLIQASQAQMQRMQRELGLVILNETTKVKLQFKSVVLPFLIVSATMLSVIFNLIPLLEASVLGALLMILTKCISSKDALASIDLQTIFVIGGTFPIVIAMENSGTITWLKNSLHSFAPSVEPVYLMALLFISVIIFTQFMHNAISAIIFAPLAVVAARVTGSAYEPFMMAVAIGATCSFMTPVAHATNILVSGAGEYQPKDYAKVGLFITILVIIICLIHIPMYWPFGTP